MILSRKTRNDADRVTLDQLVRHNATRTPHRMALTDSAHRVIWGDGEARRLTWKEVEDATNAMALRIAALGLPQDAVVAMTGGTSVDTVVAVLSCIKAGVVPALMPATWRNKEASAAIERTSAKAILAECRVGTWRPAESLCEVAAANFAIRFVCSIGGQAPDGVIALDESYAQSGVAPPAKTPRTDNAAEHVAIITFDAGANGVFPVARSHNEWLTAGLASLAELRLSRESVLLSALGPTNLVGIGGIVIPWLMSGCCLSLHQAFDRAEFRRQIERDDATHLALPGIVAEAASREGLLDATTLERVMAVSRFGDEPLTFAPTTAGIARLVAFGEIGFAAGVETTSALPRGVLTAPIDVADGVPVIELDSTGKTLVARGAMTPQLALPGGERGGAPYPLLEDDWVSTGYPALVEDHAIISDGPRRDVVTIGGSSLALAEIESLYADMPGLTAIGARAVPDPVLGERLVLDAVPDGTATITAVGLALHAEARQVSPLAQTADVRVGDRRQVGRLAGAA